MDENLYHAKRMEMIGGFFQVALLASETEVDGERHAYINSTLAVDAMEHLLAAIIESSPHIKPRKDIRAITEMFEKRLRLGIEHLRQEFDRTGRHPFPVINAN
ncbi:hypothetical protein [Sphingomonas sp. PL20]|uniref:hypothetical protein n=1 Tax=Sphingomonas sp. PL20 TaxID=2760712 RepID=UPI001AE63BC6